MRSQPSWLDTGASAVPFGQGSAKSRTFTALGALPVRLPLRSDTGERLLTWSNIIIVTLAMLALYWFDNAHFGLFTLFGGGVIFGNHTALLNFALAWSALAVFEHFKRKDEARRGVQPHTYSPGISRLGLNEFIPYSPKVIAVAIEPALAFLAGAVARRLGFSMLGWVIIASSLCFALSEWRFFQQDREHGLDLDNIGKEAQWQGERVKRKAERKASRGDGPATGLATGIDGLEGSIGNRRREGDDEDNAALAGGVR